MGLNEESFWKVNQPFRIYERYGTSDSNTWVGRSKALTANFWALNAKPGEQIHVLPGGTFLIRQDGTGAPIRFEPPKHIFEKTYGGAPTDTQRLERLTKLGRAETIDKSQIIKADYRSLMERAEKWLGDHVREVIEREPSPERAAFEAQVRDLQNHVEDWKVHLPPDTEGQEISCKVRETPRSVTLAVSYDDYHRIMNRADPATGVSLTWRPYAHESVAPLILKMRQGVLEGPLPGGVRDRSSSHEHEWATYEIDSFAAAMDIMPRAIDAYVEDRLEAYPAPGRGLL